MGVVMVSTGLGAGVLQARHEKWEWKIVIGSRSLSRTFTGCLRPALLNPKSAWLHCTCQVSHTVMKRAPSALDTSAADVGGEAQLFLFYSCLFVFLT